MRQGRARVRVIATPDLGFSVRTRERERGGALGFYWLGRAVERGTE